MRVFSLQGFDYDGWRLWADAVLSDLDGDVMIKRFHREAEGGAVAAGLGLITIGMGLGMVLLMLAKSCDREPMPAAVHSFDNIRCSVCHFDRLQLDSGKKYRAYHQSRPARKVFYDAEEQEYLARLIVGGKP
jgi:hypothetical protein